jgi:hypothetical protein
VAAIAVESRGLTILVEDRVQAGEGFFAALFSFLLGPITGRGKLADLGVRGQQRATVRLRLAQDAHEMSGPKS